MAEYKTLQTDAGELRRAVTGFESAKAGSQSPIAAFSGIMSSVNAMNAGAGQLSHRPGAVKRRGWRSGGTAELASMLEFGFENLRWSDVSARVQQGLTNIDAVIGYVKARVAAEERYGKALREVADSTGSSSVFGSLIGARGDVSMECNTLFAAIEASKQASGKVCGTVVILCDSMR